MKYLLTLTAACLLTTSSFAQTASISNLTNCYCVRNDRGELRQCQKNSRYKNEPIQILQENQTNINLNAGQTTKAGIFSSEGSPFMVATVEDLPIYFNDPSSSGRYAVIYVSHPWTNEIGNQPDSRPEIVEKYTLYPTNACS
jgi:hypothetical protein